MHIFLESTKSVGGTAAMASIITALAMCANVGFLASASRVLWAFARDRGIPGHRILSKVGRTL
jgi:amino acid transporter